jgi:hypothetical protein
MTIEEAIEAYKSMAPKIFQKKWWTANQSWKYLGAENKEYWFKGENLKDSVCQLLEDKGFDANMKLLESDSPPCRV